MAAIKLLAFNYLYKWFLLVFVIESVHLQACTGTFLGALMLYVRGEMAQEVSSSHRRLAELPPATYLLFDPNRKALHLAYPVSQLLIPTRLTTHWPFLPALNRLLLPRHPLQQTLQ